MANQLERALGATGSKARRPGRPTRYTRPLAKVICKYLASGKSLRWVSRRERMPHRHTIMGWAMDPSHEFSDHYARARDIATALRGDEIIELGDGPESGEGDSLIKIARDRLRSDNRKWVASRLLPKLYGDRVEQTHKMDDSAAFIAFLRDEVSPKRPKPALHVMNGARSDQPTGQRTEATSAARGTDRAA